MGGSLLVVWRGPLGARVGLSDSPALACTAMLFLSGSGSKVKENIFFFTGTRCMHRKGHCRILYLSLYPLVTG